MDKRYPQTFRDQKSIRRIAQIKAVLKKKPMTAKMLGKELGFDQNTGRCYLVHLRPHIYIAEWHTRPTGGRPAQAWKWGTAPDAPLVLPSGNLPAKDKLAQASAVTASRRPPARRSADVAMLFGAAR